jgi:membrane protease YdiL (CAAX protease family)
MSIAAFVTLATTYPTTAPLPSAPAATQPYSPTAVDWSGLGLVTPMALGALALAAWTGVFRRRNILGPPRVAPGESLGTLLFATLFAFAIWITLPAWYLHRTGTPTTIPANPPTIEVTPGLLRASVLASGFALVVMLAINAVLRPHGLKLLGLHRSQFLRGLLSGILGAVILIGLVFFASALTEILWQALHYEHPREHELLRVLKDARDNRGVSFLVLFSAWVIAPLFEEVFFRGHIQTLIVYGLYYVTHREAALAGGFNPIAPAGPPSEHRLPLDYATPRDLSRTQYLPSPGIRWLGILITSALFAAVHAGWMAPPIFLLSVCVGYAYERTASLWTPIIMHAGFNVTSTLIFLKFGVP